MRVPLIPEFLISLPATVPQLWAVVKLTTQSVTVGQYSLRALFYRKPILPERRWHRTYAEWEAAAEQHFKRLNDQGIRTVKAEIRSADFVAWCRRTGRNIDNKALVALANEAAYRVIKGGH
ncbi:hypothetical protein XF_0703 [Xylella fastidiosa 9a5c]|uniref:Uncharacterized protein n=1 Tax=Xylella fastidiosa (strain 9a5c) TaxID=160492 RepID=Q9PFF6_XYLFA|nr:hypothetical protein [Xylella fastidiosa]AAF83513.1 hypothetical protein XF_0703 [Xylella fastidiosa 9a5c]